MKTKTVKKKATSRDQVESESDDESTESVSKRRTEQEFMGRDEIVKELKKQSALKECSEKFIETVASRLQRQE